MVELSEVYAKTYKLMEEGKVEEAATEFNDNFIPTARVLYSNCARNYPPKYEKIDDWCSWVRNFYILADQSNKAMAKHPEKGSDDYARTMAGLIGLRAHFFTLHQLTDLVASNDYIFAFWRELADESDNTAMLKEAVTALSAEDVKLSKKAKANPDQYAEALAKWKAEVEPVLADDKIEDGEAEKLQTATTDFYKAYGIQFE
ncbi:MAG: hypothetical protein ACLFUS_13870 [Candidatus Sumerlaeia bacterium]